MYKTYDGNFHADDLMPARETTSCTTVPPNTDSITIGELSREAGVTLRALRFYQSKGLLTPQRHGVSRVFSSADRARLALIKQGKRLGFTLFEIRDLLAAGQREGAKMLSISRKKCVEQIRLLEHQRHDLESALVKLREIYTAMSIAPVLSSEISRTASGPVAKTA
jgi:DNA-binding transcriptional MerR regulator